MSTSTEGIVLRTIRYSENQLIVHLLTKEFGRFPAIVRRNRKKGSSNYFQPLFHLSVEVNFLSQRTMQRIQQLRFAHPYTDIPFSVQKSTIAQFLAEILSKVVPEQQPDKEFFSFLSNAFQLFDAEKKNPQNFHLLFLLHLTRFLGIFPSKKTKNQAWFSPSEGAFVTQIMHDTIPEELNASFSQLLHTPLSGFHELQLDRITNQALLNQLLEYYYIQLNMSKLKTYEILRQVFN